MLPAHSFVFIRIALAMALVGMTVSCALTPATVKRVGYHGSFHCPLQDLSLSKLLEMAIEDPDSRESAHALGHFVETWHRERGGTDHGEIAVSAGDGGTRRYMISFSGSHGSFPLNYFDEISPAVDYRVKRIQHHKRDGIGAPMVALRENRLQEPIEAFYPPEAITRPITAVINPGRMSGGVRSIQIDLLCPLLSGEKTFHGAAKPLAADFSVPWGALLARSGKLVQSRVGDILDRTPKHEPQLYLMEPYDPNKEPLIMIHGLLSTPLTWAQLSNELWADDEIRSRYQIWHYLYNTSAPALYSGRILSTRLRELRTLLDPSGRDPAMQSSTVIAHSMGGLVTRRLTTRPGDAFWKAAFTRPFESLDLTEDDRETLRRAFFWEPEPHLKRAIYICTPHRGSDYADSLVGWIGTLLVKPPDRFEAFYHRISSANPGAFTPEYAELGRGELDSVSSLSPRQPTLKILADLPNHHRVREFSIIGNRGKPGPLESSSDGIVPYSSSHLDRAESEKIVPSDHSAIDHEETVAEIKRILKLP